MKKIVCQYPHEKKGCSFCGGFRVILERVKCGKKGCKRSGWVRPGPYSVYEGKSIFTVDGLQLIYHTKRINCIYCEK